MLAVNGINQFYGGSHILRDVSLTVPEGACTVLLGRNGVGKTTLLKCLMGLLRARTGSVVFRGEDITGLAPYDRAKRGIAYVPQGREIFPRLTVAENLQIGLTAVSGCATVPQDVFSMFPTLKHMLHRRGGDLSGGQQQQLAIGRALAMRPKLLILDEPTEGIQPSIIQDIERVIRILVGKGNMAVLLVEQYYEFSCSVANHFAVMTRGEIIKRGVAEDMDRQNIHAYLAL